MLISLLPEELQKSELIVIEGIKALTQRLFALEAEVALMTIRHFTMFMSLGMTPEPTLHNLNTAIVD